MPALAERHRPLRRREYERLVADGAFRDERLELIRGIILRKSPQDSPHATVVQLLTRWLSAGLQGRADLRVQLPFAASDDSMPEPDLAIVAPMSFGDPHPTAAHLVVEPAAGSYLRRTPYRAGETVAPGAFPAARVDVAALFRPRA